VCIDEVLVFEDIELDSIVYKITIEPNGYLDNSASSEKLNFFGRLFRVALKGLNYNEIQRNLYNVAKAVSYPKHRLEVWPGYFSSVNLY